MPAKRRPRAVRLAEAGITPPQLPAGQPTPQEGAEPPPCTCPEGWLQGNFGYHRGPKSCPQYKERTADVRPITPVPDQPAPGPRDGDARDAVPVSMSGPLLSERPSADGEVTGRVASRSARDSLGFPTDAQPHVTAAQLRWLTFRLEAGDNVEACELSGVDPLSVLTWMGDPEFFGVFTQAMENKREGFRVLTSHLLPAVIRSLDDLLRTGSNKDKKEASALILRAQGLLVDKTSVVNPDAVATLFSLLRQDQPVQAQILDMTNYRSLEPGES